MRAHSPVTTPAHRLPKRVRPCGLPVYPRTAGGPAPKARSRLNSDMRNPPRGLAGAAAAAIDPAVVLRSSMAMSKSMPLAAAAAASGSIAATAALVCDPAPVFTAAARLHPVPAASSSIAPSSCVAAAAQPLSLWQVAAAGVGARANVLGAAGAPLEVLRFLRQEAPPPDAIGAFAGGCRRAGCAAGRAGAPSAEAAGAASVYARDSKCGVRP